MKNKYNKIVFKKHWMTIFGIGILGIILTIATCNYLYANSKTNKIYNQTKDLIEKGDSVIINQLLMENTKTLRVAKIAKDSLHKDSSELFQQTYNDDITLSTQKLVNLYQYIFKEHLTEMESLRKKIFDSNTVTFLVSFVLVFLGGILFNIETRSNTQLRKTKIHLDKAVARLREIDKTTEKANEQLTNSKNRLDDADEQLSKMNETFKQTEEQLNNSKDLFNKAGERLCRIDETFIKTEKQFKETKDQLAQTEVQLNNSKDLLEKYEQAFNGLLPQIQIIRVLSILIQNTLIAKEYCIDESISSLIYNTYNSTMDILNDIQADHYKSITRANQRFFDDILEKIIYAFEIERIDDNPRNTNKTKQIKQLIEKLTELQTKIRGIEIIT